MRFLLHACSVALVGALSVVPVTAQDFPSDAPPAHIAAADGNATLDRESESLPAAPGIPVIPGDRLRTTQARMEILFPDGTALDVDEYSTVEIQSPTLLRVSEGRILLVVAGAASPSTAARFHIDTPVAGADTYGPGEYRLSLTPGRSGLEAELAVIRGSAALTGDLGSMPLGAGERSVALDGVEPSYAQAFNSARLDAFDRWAADRRDDRRGSRSAQYLPDELRMYGGEFDRDGSWQYENSYGYVWYPAVAQDWRPYYNGYWTPVPTYGWTWIGVDRWAWPTHHYGRWGLAGARWFWIPDRRWAPAWVSWGAAPGYVSWCPLGFNDRPVFSLAASFGSSRGGFNAWVVLPRERFGNRYTPVRQWAVNARSLPARTPFIAQANAPVLPRRAASRIVGGGRSDARIAVPRGQVPSADRQWQIRPSENGRALPQRGLSPRTQGSPAIRRGAEATAPGRAVPRYRATPRDGTSRTDTPRATAPTAPAAPGLSPVTPRGGAVSRSPRRESADAPPPNASRPAPSRAAPGASAPNGSPAMPGSGRTPHRRVAPRAAAPPAAAAPAAPRASAPPAGAAAPRRAVPRSQPSGPSASSSPSPRRGEAARSSGSSGSSGQRHSRRAR